MGQKSPENAYLVTNKETGTKKIVRAGGQVGARNHAADGLFDIKYLKAGEAMDLASQGIAVETAGKKAQNDGAGANDGEGQKEEGDG